jgi:hypothetical protein
MTLMGSITPCDVYLPNRCVLHEVLQRSVSPAGNWRLGEEQQDGYDSWQNAGREVQSSADVSTIIHQCAELNFAPVN